MTQMQGVWPVLITVGMHDQKVNVKMIDQSSLLLGRNSKGPAFYIFDNNGYVTEITKIPRVIFAGFINSAHKPSDETLAMKQNEFLKRVGGKVSDLVDKLYAEQVKFTADLEASKHPAKKITKKKGAGKPKKKTKKKASGKPRKKKSNRLSVV